MVLTRRLLGCVCFITSRCTLPHDSSTAVTAAALDSATRLSLVRALILLRNRGALSALEILPSLFRLFRCQDKALRQLLFRHIISGQRIWSAACGTFVEVSAIRGCLLIHEIELKQASHYALAL